MDFAVILTDTMVLAESSSSSEGRVGLAFMLFAAGPAFYMYMYRRYRNKDKRHTHELETPTKKLNLEADDRLLRRLKGVSNSKMQGANNTAVHGSSVTGRGRNFLKNYFD